MADSQELKKAFFSHQDSFFGKKPTTYHNFHMREITSIFSSIANKPQYQEIRKRYKIHHAIKLGLSQTHLGFIVYVAYKSPVLTIMATNHVGQTELNYQKMALIKHLKRYKDFKDIQKISILRYDRVKAEEELKYPKAQNENIKIKPQTFNEKSYGIFENNISDEKLYKKIEEIRKLIKKKL
ncbi:MAG: hypothetical protein KAQ94_01685 [Arcobacteraceae bacterium]|nr:hypothetical protein [Arcobacteraceae bacterium]